jgi:hypothetical protein
MSSGTASQGTRRRASQVEKLIKGIGFPGEMIPSI